MAGCLPCFILPLLLFIFHRFLQPLILKYWNPWAVKDENKNKTSAENEQNETSSDKCVPCEKLSNFCSRIFKKEKSDDKCELIGDQDVQESVLTKSESKDTCCLRK